MTQKSSRGLWLNRIRYSIYTPIYDLVVSALQTSRKKAIDRLDIPAHCKILIVGAGTGKDLELLPVDAEITAIDITPSMLNRLTVKADKLGLKVTTEVMDASEMSFADEQFDLVLLHLILAVVPDPEGCIKEAERVLKPDGQISIMDKFVPEGGQASAMRKVANLFTRVLFSDITRQAEPYLQLAELKKISDQGVFLSGQFRHLVVEKDKSVSGKASKG